jgi:phosphatidylinositol 4-kinase
MPGMYLPLSRVGEPHFAIVRIPEREVTLLTAKDRAPYMLFLEIITLPPTGAVESSNGSIPSDGIVPVSAEASPKADEPKALIQSSPLCGAKDIDALGKAYADHIKAFWPRPARTPSPSPSPSSTSALSSTPSTASPVTAVVAPVPSKETPLAQLTRQAHPPLELERLETKKQRVQQSSPFGHIPGWDLMPVIVKYGSDALQEQMALQLIDQFSNIFQEAGLPLILTPNRILVLDSDTCFLQPLVNTISVHQLKKYNNNMSIVEFLKKRHGAAAFPQVQRRFLCSLAAYSLVCYLLQIKDRHNGNILIDEHGGIAHIDLYVVVFYWYL